MKLVRLHDYDGTPIFVNAYYVTAIYYDRKKESCAVDYGSGETFYVANCVEEVAKKVTEAVTAYEGRCLANVRSTR